MNSILFKFSTALQFYTGVSEQCLQSGFSFYQPEISSMVPSLLKIIVLGATHQAVIRIHLIYWIFLNGEAVTKPLKR